MQLRQQVYEKERALAGAQASLAAAEQQLQTLQLERSQIQAAKSVGARGEDTLLEELSQARSEAEVRARFPISIISSLSAASDIRSLGPYVR